MFHCKLITKGTKANGMDKYKNESEDAAHAMADNGIGYTISACCAPSDSENTQHSTAQCTYSTHHERMLCIELTILVNIARETVFV